MKNINEVMKQHTTHLMSIDGVVGVGIGELESSQSCITVMVIKEDEKLKKKIPMELNGYPVKIHVSGVIRPM